MSHLSRRDSSCIWLWTIGSSPPNSIQIKRQRSSTHCPSYMRMGRLSLHTLLCYTALGIRGSCQVYCPYIQQLKVTMVTMFTPCPQCLSDHYWISLLTPCLQCLSDQEAVSLCCAGREEDDQTSERSWDCRADLIPSLSVWSWRLPWSWHL